MGAERQGGLKELRSGFRSRLGRDGDLGDGLKLCAQHPEDLALPGDDGPVGTVRSGDFKALEDLLDLAGAARVAQGNAVAGAAGADTRRGLGSGGLGVKLEAEGTGLAGDGQRDLGVRGVGLGRLGG